MPTVLINVSPQTMKDVSLLIADAVTGYETEYGEIKTAFTKLRAANAGRKKNN